MVKETWYERSSGSHEVWQFGFS